MLHLIKIVACLIIIEGLHTVDAQAIGSCVDELIESLTNGTETCIVMTYYVKCMFQVYLYKTPNKTDLTQFQRQFEAGLSEKDINCQIDVMAIAEKLLENDRNGVVHTTVRPKGYKNAKTVGECIDTFTAQPSSKVMCDRMTHYLKCIIRVSNIHSLTSNHTQQYVKALEHSVKDVVGQLKNECDITMSALINEVRREEGVEKGSTLQQGNGEKGSTLQQENGENGSTLQQENGENGSTLQQENGENGADTIVGSLSFVILLILTFASVFVH